MYPWQATVQDDAGNAVPLPVVTVYDSAGALASIYDESGAALSNPLTGTIEGFVQFWAAAGEYRIVGAGVGETTDEWFVDLGNTPFAPDDWSDFQSDVAINLPDGATASFNGVQFVRSRGASITGLGAGDGWRPIGVIDLRHFGAVCDGVTNDGDAVKAAAAYGGYIKVTGLARMDEKTVTLIRDDTTFYGDGGFLKIAHGLDPDVTFYTGPDSIDNDTFFRLDGARNVIFKCGFVTRNPSSRIYGVTATNCVNVKAIGSVVGDASVYGHMYFMFVMNGSDDCGVIGCSVQNIASGYATGGLLGDAYSMDGKVTNVVCEGNTFKDLRAEGVDLNWQTEGGGVIGNLFDNCVLAEPDGEPLDIGGGHCSNIIVRDNIILGRKKSRRGIWVKVSSTDPIESSSRNIKIINNYIDGGWLPSEGDSGYVAIQLGNNCSDIVISGNTILGFWRGFNTFPTPSIIVSNNHVTANQIGGLTGPRAVYSGNTFIQNSGQTVHFLDILGSGSRILGNTISANTSVYAINIQATAPDVMIAGNSVSGGGRSIHVASTGCMVKDNDCNGASGIGINVAATASMTTVIGNNVVGAGSNAIVVAAGCNGFEVSGNLVNYTTSGTFNAYTFGTSSGSIVRNNRAKGTTVAVSGLTNLTNSLSETPLIVP